MQFVTRQLGLIAIVGLLAPVIGAQGTPPADASTPPASGSPSIGRKIALAGVPNFGEVTPTLYRGAQPTSQGFDSLAKMGVNIVVDLRGTRSSEREEVTKLGMKYVSIPWHCYHPEDATFVRFLTLLRENPGKKVFVHCRVGEDRTGMMIASYRMAEQGWNAEAARREMDAFGFSTFHLMICPGLASYEKDFPRQLQTSPAFQSLRPTAHSPAQQP